MRLTLSPIRGLPGQPETILSVAGDVLTVNGVAYDLSPVPEGGRATPNGDDHPFIGAITRESGVIHATVMIFMGDDASGVQPVDPEHWKVNADGGEVTLPVLRRPAPEGVAE